MKFAFVRDHRSRFDVDVMCAVRGVRGAFPWVSLCSTHGYLPASRCDADARGGGAVSAFDVW